MAEHEAVKAATETVEELTPLQSLLDKVDLTLPRDGEKETASAQLSSALSVLMRSVVDSKRSIDRVDKVLIDSFIAEIDTRLSSQVNSIMHHEEFQKLESSWRGLRFLVDRTNFRRNIRLQILNVSKQELHDDFDDAPETMQSGLFKQLYQQEYDQYGGEPVGAIVGNYEFENNVGDLELLRNMSKIGAACHAPFIGSVGPRFFGLKDVGEMPLLPDIGPIFEQGEYAAWRSFRETEDSRYVGLTLPKFLLRVPYGTGTVPAKTFAFEEEAAGDSSRYLWGNASFAFAQTLTSSFADNGWCVNIRGPKSGGLIEQLPVHTYEAAGETTNKIPTEILVSDRREFELAELGFIPLTVNKSQDFACFFSANSTQNPKKYLNADATANSRLSARLPYLFLCSRLAHYLKVIQRENIGAAKEKEELQQELVEWIKTLVTEMKNPDADLKARCPLSAARIEVTDIEDNPGFYKVEMLVRPHFQIEGVDVNLSLVSRLPKAKK